MKQPKWKYGEATFLRECEQYIASTYSKHYVGENDIQTVDVWASLGSARTTVRDTAIKYLMRFGKKNGNNVQDLLKAVHYIVLLNQFTFNTKSAPATKSKTKRKTIKRKKNS